MRTRTLFFGITGGIALVAVAVAGLYKSTFSREALRTATPASWNETLLSLTHDDIVRRLGQPQDDASAKDWQSWIQPTWWGTLELRLAFSGCCEPSTRPTAGHVIAHLKGRYRPIDAWQLKEG